MEMKFSIENPELVGKRILFSTRDDWKNLQEGYVQDRLSYVVKIGGKWYFNTELNLVHVFSTAHISG